MHVPNQGQNGPVMKGAVEESCLPERRLTSHQTVWGRGSWSWLGSELSERQKVLPFPDALPRMVKFPASSSACCWKSAVHWFSVYPYCRADRELIWRMGSCWDNVGLPPDHGCDPAKSWAILLGLQTSASGSSDGATASASSHLGQLLSQSCLSAFPAVSKQVTSLLTSVKQTYWLSRDGDRGI